MFVIVNKANHTFFGMILSLCSNFEESSFENQCYRFCLSRLGHNAR